MTSLPAVAPPFALLGGGSVRTGARPGPAGPHDEWDIDRIVALVAEHPAILDMAPNVRSRPSRGARAILEWLSRHPGHGWQDRWIRSGADTGLEWIDVVSAAAPPEPLMIRQTVQDGFRLLMLVQVLRPSYDCIAYYRLNGGASMRKHRCAEEFDLLAELCAETGLNTKQSSDALLLITKVVLHTGKTVGELNSDDLLEYGEWSRARLRHKVGDGYHPAWDLFLAAGIVAPDEAAIGQGSVQRMPPETPTRLVDRYGIRNPQIRLVLIRYISERQASMDHNSMVGMATHLVKLFWADIERHHPEIQSLHLSPEVAEAWRHRVCFKADGTPRLTARSVLGRVRAFYLDIQEWALEDPSWAQWAVPSPVRARDTVGHAKERRRATARMHQRVRERLPLLPVLVAAAERYKTEQERLLSAATAAAVGETFTVGEISYRRIQTTASLRQPTRFTIHDALIENIATGEQIDAVQTEEGAFWGWAIIETLRHTGVRVEELTEITHLALVSYRLADTGELVPMLQIVPSKTDEERVLLVSPELASVLASIITRLRKRDGQVLLVSRWDPHERVASPALPHLFQHKIGLRPQVMTHSMIQRRLSDTLRRAGLKDNAGQDLRFTPHDFRRMFATDAVTGGLPVHIAAKLLGHRSLATTQAYLAIFDDELVHAYRAFLGRRRTRRPEAEYREPTSTEWQEFQQHFELRKVELGSCSRPYGTPCNHEHACIRCPMLRIDPRQRPRLMEIIHNLTERITEAKQNSWHGEVEGLRVSQQAAQAKLAGLDRGQSTPAASITDLGLPVLRARD